MARDRLDPNRDLAIERNREEQRRQEDSADRGQELERAAARVTNKDSADSREKGRIDAREPDLVRPEEPAERAVLREQKIAEQAKRILDDRAIELRFEGRGWESLYPDEKLSVFSEIEECVAHFEGRDRAPVTKCWGENDGEYRWGLNLILINEASMLSSTASKEDAVMALLHEEAHATQRAAIEKPELYPEIPASTIEQWRENKNNYFHPPTRGDLDYDAKRRIYLDQPLERDATTMAKERYDGIRPT